MGTLRERRRVRACFESCLASARDIEERGREEREAEAWGKRPGDLGGWVATVISATTGAVSAF